MRKKCRSRAAIEPVIEHIKHDCRMERNYLKGVEGGIINALLAAAALNFRRLLKKIEQEIIFSILQRKYCILIKLNPSPIFSQN